MSVVNFIIIPAEGPIRFEEHEDTLEFLQHEVGGYIEAVPLPEFVRDADCATAYVHGEGKFDPDCKPNMRATDFMVPGVGLFMGDHIAGTFIIAGFDVTTGEHTEYIPARVVERVRLIEREATV